MNGRGKNDKKKKERLKEKGSKIKRENRKYRSAQNCETVLNKVKNVHLAIYI